MVTPEEIDRFLERLSAEGASYSEVETGLWAVKPGGELDLTVVVHHSPPVVVLRVKVMTLPSNKADADRLCRRLLELNATDLLHGSYGIQQDEIVLTEALELSHLDYEEFLASFESITLALASHLRELSTFREARD
ncbi:MAG: type III secretion system chaperone family protein [Gemmatimonadaceae bacterium]